jgi:hypothetical protein
MLEDDPLLKYLMTATLLAVLAFAPISLAQIADGEIPAPEPVCDDLNGALYGLCVADCEAMDCHLGDPFASDRACERVLTHYMTHSDGDLPPCNSPVKSSEDEGSGDTDETDEGAQEGDPQA